MTPQDVSKFGKGGIRHKPSFKHKRLEAILKFRKFFGRGSLDVDAFISPVKNQGTSGSCGGQATAYYTAVLQAILTGNYNERSAKSVYSNVFLQGGGSSVPDLVEYASTIGLNLETTVPSYQNNQPPDEQFMEDRSWDSPTLQDPNTNALDGDEAYFDATNWQNIENALSLGKGFIIGVGGTNPTWTQADIEIPDNPDWWHLIYCEKIVMRNGQPTVQFINSWGSEWGENGRGFLPQGYFTNNLVSSGCVLNAIPAGEYTILMKLVAAYKNLISILLHK